MGKITDERVARVRKWIDGGGSSWGLPMQDIEAMCAALEREPAQLTAGEREPVGTVADIVPAHCTGKSLAFSEGVLHVNKDGSGWIAVDEQDFELEDDRCEGPDGPQGSVHWITRFPAEEMQSLRDFLCGVPFTSPPASELEALRKERDEASTYLRNLLHAFVSEHFPDNDGWKPLDDLVGMLTQIDNASTIAREYKARLAEALKALDHCEELLMHHQINHVSHEEISDAALELIRAARRVRDGGQADG